MYGDIIETVGLDTADFAAWSGKSAKFQLHQIRRKIRYNCFAMMRGDTSQVPKKFITYYEDQQHFSGWALFADRWDVLKSNPLMTYPRKFSALEEWEATLRLAVPDLPNAISYKQGQ